MMGPDTSHRCSVQAQCEFIQSVEKWDLYFRIPSLILANL